MIDWKSFAFGDEYQTLMLKSVELLDRKKSDKLLMDARQGSVIKAEDQIWTEEVFVERAHSSGLRYLAMVQPKSVVANSSLRRTINRLGALPYQYVEFSEWKEAVQWLNNSMTQENKII
ncbi:hypothetical protein [Cohnella sp. REN36]|uniref:hypothetical protein n=1 Tax=Cohnella sp. REN36 TaxID=2887347 RepID=UPI001D13CBD0|nr:hypothetical protein [Cohnella sp. REN36]MCC3371896.1 hypothetical protein [Cohnella sp. REN36]